MQKAPLIDLMPVLPTIRKYLNIAYRPGREGLRYEEVPHGGTTKTVVESMSAVLALYAAYSELSEKLLKAFSLEQTYYPSVLVKVVTCILGIFVCLHILFGRKTGDANVLAYSRIARVLAGVIIWLVLLSLGITVYDLMSQTRPSLGLNSASYELPVTECRAQANPDSSEASALRRYVCRLAIPSEYKVQYQDLKVFVMPIGEFTLANVAPLATEGIVLPRDQEPLEAGRFDNLRSDWVFPKFDPNKDWKMSIALDKSKVKGRLPDQPPLKITIYFYK